MREEDTVARLGGDEFCLILSHLSRRDEADVIAQKLLDALKEPLLLEGQEICVSASIGITVFPEEGDSAEALLKNADRAMYLAKGRGRGQYAGVSC